VEHPVDPAVAFPGPLHELLNRPGVPDVGGAVDNLGPVRAPRPQPCVGLRVGLTTADEDDLDREVTAQAAGDELCEPYDPAGDQVQPALRDGPPGRVRSGPGDRL